MEICLDFDYNISSNKNNLNLTKNEITEQIKLKIDGENFEPVIFSPKYCDQAKIALDKINLGNIDEIIFFGGFRNYYGYYKYSQNNIYLFEIHQNQININYPIIIK
jgi:hypothetical protein